MQYLGVIEGAMGEVHKVDPYLIIRKRKVEVSVRDLAQDA